MFCLCKRGYASVPTIRNQRCRRFNNSPAGLVEHVNLQVKGQRAAVKVEHSVVLSVHKRAAQDTVRDLQYSTVLYSTWRHGRSGFDSTSPGPMMLKVASMCIGFGSLNEMMWIL